jgi:hypothetical protein
MRQYRFAVPTAMHAVHRVTPGAPAAIRTSYSRILIPLPVAETGEGQRKERRTRCAPPSLPRRLKTERSSKTCRKPPRIVTGTTKLYDRRGYNPEKAASFFATY